MAVLFMTVSVTSCLNWDDEEELFFLAWASVASNDKAPTLNADNGMILHALNEANTDTTFYEVGDRVYVQFTLGDTTQANGKEYPVYITNYMKVLTKDFVTVASDTDTVYQDAFLSKLNSAILSGDYLNCILAVYASYASVNTVELVRYKQEESNLPTDTLPVIYLTLQHNTPAIDRMFAQVKALSFSLSPLLAEFPLAKTFTLRLSWKDDNRQNDYDLLYTPTAPSN